MNKLLPKEKILSPRSILGGRIFEPAQELVRIELFKRYFWERYSIDITTPSVRLYSTNSTSRLFSVFEPLENTFVSKNTHLIGRGYSDCTLRIIEDGEKSVATTDHNLIQLGYLKRVPYDQVADNMLKCLDDRGELIISDFLDGPLRDQILSIKRDIQSLGIGNQEVLQLTGEGYTKVTIAPEFKGDDDIVSSQGRFLDLVGGLLPTPSKHIPVPIRV